MLLLRPGTSGAGPPPPPPTTIVLFPLTGVANIVYVSDAFTANVLAGDVDPSFVVAGSVDTT